MNDEQHPEDLIRYDILTQDALRDVIRKVLQEVSTSGLPGEHHFFITFRTDHPSVRLSTRMRERYPEEMTIVIQHSFWDLKIRDTYFEIDLSFDDILERLRIPFSSLKGFFDPHVNFGVQFDSDFADEDDSENDIQVVIETENIEETENLPTVSQTREVSKASKNQESTSDEDETEGAEIVSLDQFRKKQ